MSIETDQHFTWEHSNKELNKPKNRYANVIAYDHSRVVLKSGDGRAPCSDYVNANFIDGYRKPKAYVATQGPLPETFGDFWLMIFEQNCPMIVMLTKLEERSRVKCDQYWPSPLTPARSPLVYGSVQVATKEILEFAHYTLRIFEISKIGSQETREVKQMQFTAWPDHGVPDYPTPFLMFLRRVKALTPVDAGPIIVHC
uniref:Tyrosine-protein phosphatase domain-containing protein n=1 Tax=Romanomermis culicivorax TaxID=13658 RepID=A0A915JU46_ROMCU